MSPTNVAKLIPVSITGHVGIEVADLTADIWSIHKHVHEQIEKSNTGYRGATERHCHWAVFNEGDLVWIYFRKGWFTPGTRHKLKQQRIGPCNVTETINNVYFMELQVDLNISNIFNVADLSPFYEVAAHAEDEDKGENLRSSSSRAGEEDADDNDAREDHIIGQAMAHMDAYDRTHGVQTHCEMLKCQIC